MRSRPSGCRASMRQFGGGAARAGVGTDWSRVVGTHEPGVDLAGRGDHAWRIGRPDRHLRSIRSGDGRRRAASSCRGCCGCAGRRSRKRPAAVDPAWLPGARAVEGPGTLLERTIDRALKALNLVLQSGVCTAVVSTLRMSRWPASAACRSPPGCACSASSKAPTRRVCCWVRCRSRAAPVASR